MKVYVLEVYMTGYEIDTYKIFKFKSSAEEYQNLLMQLPYGLRPSHCCIEEYEVE